MTVSAPHVPRVSELFGSLRQTPAAYLRAAREIETGQFTDLRPITVALAATFTAELLRPYVVVECARLGLAAAVHVAPFDHMEQAILDPASVLYQARPDVVVIAMRLEEAAVGLVDRFVARSPVELDEELARLEGRVVSLLAALRRSSTATALVWNFAPPSVLAAGLADASLEPSQSAITQRANERLAAACRAVPDAHVFDYARLVCEFGLARWADPKLWHLGRIPFGADAQVALGRRLARCLRAASATACKCLVLDLDNTLWGGVVGEEGWAGVALGDAYPGSVFKEFQRRLLALKDRGVLLAIASKNNPADAQAVFERNPECLLKPSDFAAVEIHWGDKAQSLTAIARQLNIGTDVLVFVDDDPVERAWVRARLPEVTVIDLPESPLGYADAIEESGAFDRLRLFAEDRERPERYRQQGERVALQEQAGSLDDFFRSLGLTATVGDLGAETLPRAAELAAKTNQFNLTTRRHTAAQLQAMMDAGAAALWLRAADRFGTYGFIGLVVAVPEGEGQWRIDTLLFSCRAIGRGLEAALLSVLCGVVRRRGGARLIGEYLPTSKNASAAGFYAEQGFERLDDDGRRWHWELSRRDVAMPSHVTVERVG